MDRVAQGGTVALTAVYQNGAGDLVDPISPTVDIIDAAGAELVTNATPTRVSLGNYSYSYAVPEGGAVGVWRIHWTGTVDGFAAGGDDWFNVVAPGDLIVPRSTFATTDDLSAYLGEELTGARLAQATLGLEMATAMIQGWTRRRLERVAGDVVVLAGTRVRELVLPAWPVVSVTAIKINGVAVVSTTYRRVGQSLYREAGWGEPGDTVEVTYTHGFDPIPDDIRAVTIQLAARALTNPLGIRQEGIGSYNVTYGGDTRGDDPLLLSLSRYRIRAASPSLTRERVGSALETAT